MKKSICITFIFLYILPILVSAQGVCILVECSEILETGGVTQIGTTIEIAVSGSNAADRVIRFVLDKNHSRVSKSFLNILPGSPLSLGVKVNGNYVVLNQEMLDYPHYAPRTISGDCVDSPNISPTYKIFICKKNAYDNVAARFYRIRMRDPELQIIKKELQALNTLSQSRDLDGGSHRADSLNSIITDLRFKITYLEREKKIETDRDAAVFLNPVTSSTKKKFLESYYAHDDDNTIKIGKDSLQFKISENLKNISEKLLSELYEYENISSKLADAYMNKFHKTGNNKYVDSARIQYKLVVDKLTEYKSISINTLGPRLIVAYDKYIMALRPPSNISRSIATSSTGLQDAIPIRDTSALKFRPYFAIGSGRYFRDSKFLCSKIISIYHEITEPDSIQFIHAYYIANSYIYANNNLRKLVPRNFVSPIKFYEEYIEFMNVFNTRFKAVKAMQIELAKKVVKLGDLYMEIDKQDVAYKLYGQFLAMPDSLKFSLGDGSYFTRMIDCYVAVKDTATITKFLANYSQYSFRHPEFFFHFIDSGWHPAYLSSIFYLHYAKDTLTANWYLMNMEKSLRSITKEEWRINVEWSNSIDPYITLAQNFATIGRVSRSDSIFREILSANYYSGSKFKEINTADLINRLFFLNLTASHFAYFDFLVNTKKDIVAFNSLFNIFKNESVLALKSIKGEHVTHFFSVLLSWCYTQRNSNYSNSTNTFIEELILGCINGTFKVVLPKNNIPYIIDLPNCIVLLSDKYAFNGKANKSVEFCLWYLNSQVLDEDVVCRLVISLILEGRDLEARTWSQRFEELPDSEPHRFAAFALCQRSINDQNILGKIKSYLIL